MVRLDWGCGVLISGAVLTLAAAAVGAPPTASLAKELQRLLEAPKLPHDE